MSEPIKGVSIPAPMFIDDLNREPLPKEVEVPEGPPVSQDPAWRPDPEDLDDDAG